jgi:hypothetical protein
MQAGFPLRLSAKKQSITGSADASAIIPIQILTDADVERASQTERILAGPRVVDPFTGKSKPLSMTPRSMSLSTLPSDLSTLYGEEVPSTEPHADVDCIAIAYKRYNANQGAANQALAACVAGVMRNFAICMAAAIAAEVFVGIGVILTGIGAAACLAYQVSALISCNEAFKISTVQNSVNLQLDLEACGVHIAQT